MALIEMMIGRYLFVMLSGWIVHQRSLGNHPLRPSGPILHRRVASARLLGQ